MGVVWRVIDKNQRRLAIISVLTLCILVSTLILIRKMHANNLPTSATETSNVAGESTTHATDETKPKDPPKNEPKPVPQTPRPKAQPAVNEPLIPVTNPGLGVYTGPGTVEAHKKFEQWLGKPVPYTTDYIDYKGGWQKDFIDSKLWLTGPWSNWVSQSGQRRLVLGLPMLQNENRGQFSEGARGDFDVYFAHLANDLVKHNLGNSIIRLGYEANCDTIGPWQATDNPEGYKQHFRRIVTVMRSVPGAAFKFDWTVCNGLQTGHRLNSFASFYPGDDVVDIIGMDIYDVKWADKTATPKQRWDYSMNRPMGTGELLRFARSHGKRVSYPEWGLYKPGDSFAGGGDNPYFIYRMAELIRTTNPAYHSYFNINWGGGVLSDFKQSEVLFKQLFGK